MHENIFGQKKSTTEQIPVIKELTVDSHQIAAVAQKLREYAAQNKEYISDESVFSAAQALVERAAENKEEININDLPLEEMINAREQIITTGNPVVDGVTGEVISHADSTDEARTDVRTHNEEKRENI